jgi:predicted nucleic acid-binding protein
LALIIDAGGLYAQADRADPAHASVVEVLKEERGPLVTSEVAVAEADYLILTRLGIDVELAFLDDLAEGTFLVECLTREELGVACDLARRHRDLELGLADTSLVVLARRHRSRRIVTFDERAFRTVAPLQGGSFTVLPADARSEDPA